MNFEDQYAAYRSLCDDGVTQAIKRYTLADSAVSQAAAYTLQNGGKRVRGVLTLAVCDMLGGNIDAACAFAAALEMMHAFSLIHDDLPCMDNDDMRRGKPACHIAYGEATALLAGDLLAIQAFEVLAAAPAASDQCMQAVRVLSASSGAQGMIYGQELDMRFEEQTPKEEDLHNIHRCKTGKLITCAAKLGIIAAAKRPEEEMAVLQYAEKVGLVFQIVDDILDVTAQADVLGKPVGSDKKSGKTTFASLYGLEKSRTLAKNLTQEAEQLLADAYGENARFLQDFANFLVERVY